MRIAALALVTALSQAQADQPADGAALSSAAVAVADRFAADAAEEVLHKGGNAADAAVAVAFSLAVTYPEAGNIGGGGFMTLVMDGHPYFIDFRERAPLASSSDMYLDAQGNVIHGMSLVGARAVGVPGTVAGLAEVHRRFGKLSWADDMAPAISYARDGFTVDELLVQRRDYASQYLAAAGNFAQYFGAMKAGEVFRQPELAHTLERIAHDGPADFYTGHTAELIVHEMQGRGLVTLADLAGYRAVWREPLEARWEGFDVVTAPPPSSGGVGLVQLLEMKSLLDPLFAGVPRNSSLYVHRVAEIEKRVFADRAEYLGDPDFYRVPVAQLIAQPYLARRAAEVNPVTRSATASVLPGLGNELPERLETTHFSLIDRAGNAVACTYTLNGYFGSGVVVSGAGFLLNDEMDDFSSKPGVANAFGLVGGDANAIAPGKRPLSSMAPTILVRDGRVALVIGTPGGSRIFTSIFQVIANLYDFHMPLADAIAAKRFHHQLLPADTIYLEPYGALDEDTLGKLTAMGYVFRRQGFNGDIQAISVEGREVNAASDPRGRGVARLIP
jgi:gamma-glutamyltranspeptidase/glutathione hydrolase